MIVDPTPGARAVEYDVCIVGSGPAGLTVANELARHGRAGRICVLESGRQETSPFADALRDVESTGIPVKEYSRERVLGGASSTWAGLSSLLDEIDFEARPWVPFSGWPLTRSDLLPYYEQAAARYRFPAPALFREERWADVLAAGDFVPRWSRISGKVFLAAPEPQRFGREFTSVFGSESVDLYLDATVVRLEGARASGAAHTAMARTSDGGELRVRARRFVLACGGIENPRLLLLSAYACPNGLGNEHDQVGRYLMNHPKGDYGRIVLDPPLRELPAYFGFLYEGLSGFVGLRASDSAQRAHELLNSYVRFRPVYDWSHSEGVEAALYYLKRSTLLSRAFRRMHRGEVVALRDYAETGDDTELQNARKTRADHLRLVARMWHDRASVIQYLKHRLSRQRVPLVRSIVVRNFMEMEPNPDNRVTLSARVDALGTPVAAVRHRPSARDRRSVHALHQSLRDEIGGARWGRLSSDLDAHSEPWPIDLDASHYMGGTRMGVDPRTSVVDADCRVHGSPNVYVAGSSVFPTSGNANPTYTLVALAIRLAEHLSGAGAPRERGSSA